MGVCLSPLPRARGKGKTPRNMSKNVVTFHYTLLDPEGRMLDSSAGGRPISYLEGVGQIIEGLDEAMAGLPAGAKTRIAVPAVKGYGERDDAQVQKV